MALALFVSIRLWLGGAVSPQWDGALIARLCSLVRTCALPAPLLICVDGFVAYVRQLRRMARSSNRALESGDSADWSSGTGW